MTKKHDVIGQPAPRLDAREKVTGEADYPGDLSLPGMLHMKILFAERPHARVLRIDTRRARKTPGVVAVYTAADVPVNEYGLQKKDQPVLCGPGSTNPAGDVVRFVGDQVAVVVAETEAQAAEALAKIEVEYQDLPAIFDFMAAREPGAPLVHPELGGSNVCVHYRIRKGNIEDGFARADVIVESEYEVPFQEHAYLQPEAGLAYLDEEGRLVVASAGQWTDADRAAIAHALDLPEDRVRVIYPAIGGAFGGREDISVQIVLALAAWKLRRPVKIVWSRRESIIGHGKRHPMRLKAKWGATRAGELTAAQMEIVADAGAYMYTTNKVLGNATITSTGPYRIPNVHCDVFGVYTNNLPTCAFRGFGAPQALFMAELQMDKLAAALGLDPVEFRLRNALRDGEALGVGTPTPGPVTIAQVIEAAARRAGWTQDESGRWRAPHPSPSPEPHLRRGWGFAGGFKNVGFSFGYQENSWARVELHGGSQIERVIAMHAGAEVGQGTHTVMAQIVAEAAGVPLEKVTLLTSDSAIMKNPGSASASRMTFMAGNALKAAAEAALEKWKNEERPAVAEQVWLAPKTTPFEPETGRSTPNFAYAYSAQAVEVEVDTETGHVRVLRVVAADDVGQAINPALVAGQIEGGVVQALGYAITEDFQVREGRVLTDQLSTYLIPTILDAPENIEPVIVEIPDPLGPYGARGVGELPFLPFAPAVVAAVQNATGVWIHRIPLTPERVLRALGKLPSA